MNIDTFINKTVRAHNLTHPDIIISKSWIAGRTWYFLYKRDFNFWDIEDLYLLKFLSERLSPEGICPSLLLREIVGEPKIGIAFEVKGEL